MKSIVLSTTSSFGTSLSDSLNILKKADFSLVKNPYERRLTEGELLELLKKYKPVGLLAGTEKINRKHFIAAKDHLKVVSRVGVGWDNVDREAAAEYGIKVFRTAGALDDAVAELTIGLMLAVLRKICSHDRNIKNGLWNKEMGSLLSHKTVGVIGFGSIGMHLGKILKAFKCRVLYYDIRIIESDWAEQVDLQTLLKCSEIITINSSGNERILSQKELSLCKPGVILVNTARGGIVDEKSLFHLLKTNAIAGAGLDVFETEPYKGPLGQLDNVVLTCHIGSYAIESRVKMEKMAVKNILEALTVHKKKWETH
jgi:D-3-phosphoglycerate dehydrogenase